MVSLEDGSLDDQSPKNQLKLLKTIEEGDKITVAPKGGGITSGKVVSKVENTSEGSANEIFVQYLDYDSNLRDDDKPQHEVEISQDGDENVPRAKLALPRSDTGRVRRTQKMEVRWIWKGLSFLQGRTVLSRRESKVILMKEMGLTTSEIADKWNLDESEMEFILQGIKKKYWKAEQTIDMLETVDIEPSRIIGGD